MHMKDGQTEKITAINKQIWKQAVESRGKLEIDSSRES